MSSTLKNKQVYRDALAKAIHLSGIENDIISVYGIGSVPKGKASINDIDLNIFVRKPDASTLNGVTTFMSKLSNLLNMKVDVNIIGMAEVNNNFINSYFFSHRYRHSLLLYETKQLDYLLYGAPILDRYTESFGYIVFEAFKLAIVQGHRISKDVLTRPTPATAAAVRKYARYTAEFALIATGTQNPYMEENAELLIKIFPELKARQSLLNWIYNPQYIERNNSINDCNDIVQDLIGLLKTRFVYAFAHPDDSERFTVNDTHQPGAYITFRTNDQLRDFQKLIALTPPEQRLTRE